MYMRGEDLQQVELFSYGSWRSGSGGSSATPNFGARVGGALREMSARFEEIYPEERASLQAGR
jgi:hypothetical protein